MALKPDMAYELRSMVREVLRDVMANRTQPAGATVETVRFTNDSDLAAFVARVIAPGTLEQIKAGQLRFTLGASSSVPLSQPLSEVLTGVITEQKLDRLAGARVLVLDPGAVLTPLARDRARKLGLKIERRR
jgi:hypothetical protein